MATTRIEYRILPGTRASIGRSGAHIVVADRPQGKSGGLGLGFNGGELLALSIGGCFCNDMHAIADQLGVTICDLKVDVEVDFGGEPVRANHARMTIDCILLDGLDPSELIELARAQTTIGNSLREGFPVSITAQPKD